MTMEERFNKKFGNANDGADGAMFADTKDFLRQEINLALQKRNEELVGKINALESKYGSYQEEEYSTVHQLLSKIDVLNIIQQH